MTEREPTPRWQRARRFLAGPGGFVLKALVAALPIVWIVRNVDLHKVAHHLAAADPLVLAGAYLVALCGPLLATLRWRLLLTAYGGTDLPRLRTLLRHYLVGMYYAMLPTGVAGEALRGYRVRASLPDLWTSYAVVLVERVCGFAGLMILASVAAITADSARTSTVQAALRLALGVSVTAAALFALFFLVAPARIARSERWRRGVLRVPVLGKLLARLPAPRSLAPVLVGVALSVLTQLVVIAYTFLVARGPAPHAGFGLFCQVVPFIMLLSYIPITPAAIGQRDMVALYFFGLVSIPREAALTISFLAFLVVIAVAALGGLVHLFEPREPKPPPELPSVPAAPRGASSPCSDDDERVA